MAENEPIYVPPVARPYLLDKREWGPMLWKQLHDRPQLTGGDLSRELEWLRGFMDAIPCPECRRHFGFYCDEHPPDLATMNTYFAWGWACHNYVNDYTGKRVVPWQEAWGPQP